MSEIQDATAPDRKQDGAIVTLLTEPTVEAAARAADIAPATIWHWSQLPDFRAKLRDAVDASGSAEEARIRTISAERGSAGSRRS